MVYYIYNLRVTQLVECQWPKKKNIEINRKDARLAETNEKSIFLFFFSVMVDFGFFEKWSEELTNFEHKNGHISKTKNQTIDFSFVSEHFASFIYVWPVLNFFVERDSIHLVGGWILKIGGWLQSPPPPSHPSWSAHRMLLDLYPNLTG